MNIEKHITNIETAPNFKLALNHFAQAINDLGYENYFFSNMNTQISPVKFTVRQYETNYPKAWTDIYMGGQYFFHDPIAIAVMAHTTPFYWSQYMANYKKPFTDEALKIMQHAADFNILDGMGMSYLRNQGNLYTLTISKGSLIESYDSDILANIYLLGAKLVESHDKFNVEKPTPIALTRQEQKIVTFGAMGKTDGEIGQLMHISVNTVRYHWKNIFEKLNSYTRVFAIIQAMNLGFVDLDIVEIPTDNGSIEEHHRNINLNQ